MFYTVTLGQDSSKLSKYISSTLLDKIEKTLEKEEKVLLYLNKRGSYSSLACKDCQYLWECPNCDASLSIHSHPNQLLCHLCASQFPFPLSCLKCYGTQLLQIGVGTQQIEEALGKYFKGKTRSGKEISHSKPHHGISSPQGEDNYIMRQSFGEVPEYIKILAKKLRNTQTTTEEKVCSLSLLEEREFKSEVLCEQGFKSEVLCEGSLENKAISIYRFDSDSMKNISSKKEALKHLDDADIIIGTKMITTGFDFEKIGLIGVILVEQELAYPSYDASEKAYANLKQLIGRGNRKSQETTIVLQTFLPKNPLIQRLCDGNYKDFFMETLKERKDFLYPPYTQMLTLEYRHSDMKKALEFTQKLEQTLGNMNHLGDYRILRGSTTFKKNNSYHAKIILQGNDVRDFLAPLHKDILGNSALTVIFV